ncbi:putative D-amino-acid oxidase [Echria macrotheca]|uniref:D-amino-acid oxidase n=1 Tax=Echria macrotheca TaxID=438768 RepID=A0AAJ0BGA8_9PEZI|nr:putative D-amino-acid oxidase [Echria macrotheca]
MDRHVVVIGAGVIGLSSALALLEAGYRVTILAKDFPIPFETALLTPPSPQINYASLWAGAHNRWVPPPPPSPGLSSSPPAALPSSTTTVVVDEHSLALTTFSWMTNLANTSSSPTTENNGRGEHGHGITLTKGIEYLENPGPEYLSLDKTRALELGISNFRLLSPHELPDPNKIKWACEYDSWCLNPAVYCSFLLRKIALKGGRLVRHDLRAVREAFTSIPDTQPIKAVVNASGTGLDHDPAVFITRGQTVLVANTCAETVTRQHADGSWTFFVPRGYDGGTVVGGTKEVDDWEALPRRETRDAILERARETYPAILDNGEEFRVVADIVGRRPSRVGGPRVEGEVLDGRDKRFVMHAYGLGGRGYELSWGVAVEVRKGVNRFFGVED